MTERYVWSRDDRGEGDILQELINAALNRQIVVRHGLLGFGEAGRNDLMASAFGFKVLRKARIRLQKAEAIPCGSAWWGCLCIVRLLKEQEQQLH